MDFFDSLSVINNLSKKNISKNHEEMGIVQSILKLQLHGDLTSVNFYRSGYPYYVHINSSLSPGTKIQGLLLLCNTSQCLMPAFCFSNPRNWKEEGRSPWVHSDDIKITSPCLVDVAESSFSCSLE